MKKILMMVTMLSLTTGAYAGKGTYETLAKPYIEAEIDSKTLSNTVQSKLADLFNNASAQPTLSSLLNGKEAASYNMLIGGGRLSLVKINDKSFNVTLNANDSNYELNSIENKPILELEAIEHDCGDDAKVQIKYADYNGNTYIIIKYSASQNLSCNGDDVEDAYDILALQAPQLQN